MGWVTAKNSNHFGIAGHYTDMAEKQGLLSVVVIMEKECQFGSLLLKCITSGQK